MDIKTKIRYSSGDSLDKIGEELGVPRYVGVIHKDDDSAYRKELLNAVKDKKSDCIYSPIKKEPEGKEWYRNGKLSKPKDTGPINSPFTFPTQIDDDDNDPFDRDDLYSWYSD